MSTKRNTSRLFFKYIIIYLFGGCIFIYVSIAGVGTYDSLCTNFNYYQLFRDFHFFLVAVALAAMSSLSDSLLTTLFFYFVNIVQ